MVAQRGPQPLNPTSGHRFLAGCRRSDLRRPLRLVLLALILAGGLVAAAAVPASAHAILETSTPGDGAVLPQSPTKVSLHFDEAVAVTSASVRVFDRRGHRVDSGDTHHSGTRQDAEVTIGAKLDAGTYIVTWRVVSADSHPVHGGFLFSVGNKSALPRGLFGSLEGQGGNTGAQVVGAGLRTLQYGGAFLAVGAAFVIAMVGSEGDRRPGLVKAVVIAAVVAVAAALSLIPNDAAIATGLGAGAISKPGVLSQVLSGGVGPSVAVLVLALAAAVVVAVRPAAVFGSNISGAQTTPVTPTTAAPSTSNSGTASDPAAGASSGTFHPNEDATHEQGESAAREAQENAGQRPTVP